MNAPALMASLPLFTPALVRAVLREYRLPPGGVHGPGHWLRVAENGAALAALTPGADAALIEVFALLHDARRLSEGDDGQHGERAAAFCKDLSRRGLLRIGSARLALLMEACAGHEKGGVSADPTIACMWDADRLELARLNVRPHPALLSTEAAKAPPMLAAAWERGRGGALNREIATRWGVLG
ncbi:hypothetical protein KPL78_06510 [Roseomonas sp. HJA6]|uniref:HD domain-containing protein n=1 Tax=Roseomonas alba TaxID=2846776 RepID=A0ABS7A842_9PROT|nr:hypothetical protein [Neoroseomonas alba]MBW6397490.1 hypothetical protein [Neoroseomonas alba]